MSNFTYQIKISNFILISLMEKYDIFLYKIWTILDTFDNLSHGCGSTTCQNKCKVCYEKTSWALATILMRCFKMEYWWKIIFVIGIGICKILFICTSSFIDNYLLIFCYLLLVIEHWISNKLINKGDEKSI